jgi:hypothetical protein
VVTARLLSLIVGARLAGHLGSQQGTRAAQAGDPQPRRGEYGPTGLVGVQIRGKTWEKAECTLIMIWIFPDR